MTVESANPGTEKKKVSGTRHAVVHRAVYHARRVAEADEKHQSRRSGSLCRRNADYAISRVLSQHRTPSRVLLPRASPI